MDNPYKWSEVNPSLFYGRQSLLDEVLRGYRDLSKPRPSFAVVGARRMGKTTLLRRIESELGALSPQNVRIVPIYISGNRLPHPTAAVHIWERFVDKVWELAPGPNMPTAARFDSDLDGALEKLGHVFRELPYDPLIIVLFDEIDRIVVAEWSGRFFENWRALLSDVPNVSPRIASIFTGPSELSVLWRSVGSPLANVLSWDILRLFDYAAARRLMEEPVGMKWPEAFCQYVYQETGGHPMLLQYIMQHVCMYPSAAADESARRAVANFLERERQQFANWWERYCTPVAQLIYAELVDAGQPLTRRYLTDKYGVMEASRALDILEHVGIAREDPELPGRDIEHRVYRFAGNMFRQWHRAFGALRETEQHDPQVYEALAAKLPVALPKYISAWLIYQQPLPNYSGALVEMRGVLEFLVNAYAPSEVVMAQPGFKLEKGTTQPTMRDNMYYIATQRYDKETAKAIQGEYNYFDIQCEQLADIATRLHRASSSSAHNLIARRTAYSALKLFDTLLLQLLPA